MGSTHFLLKKVINVILALTFTTLSFCQEVPDTFNIAISHHNVIIDQTIHPVTRFIAETGEHLFNKGFVELDSTNLARLIPHNKFTSVISYQSSLSHADTISTFSAFKSVNPDKLEKIFFAEVFYAFIGDLFFKETGKVLFGENTIIAAHEYKDFQSEPIEFEFSFLNLPIVDGSNTLYYCHFASSDINGLQLVRYDSSAVDRKKLRPVEIGLKELREAKEILHCAQFRRPDLLFADGVRYYFVPECIAYDEPKLSPEEKKKFGKIQGPMIQLYAIGNFNRKPNFFQWVKSLFK